MNEFETYQSKENKLRREVVAFIWDTVKIAVISLAIILPIRFYIASPFFVKGASMEPTFESQDYIFINKITYRFKEPKRGEVVIFRFPGNTSQFFIKRIVGLPGETIDIKNDIITIFNEKNPDGFELDESGYLAPNQETYGNISVKIDEGDYFVLGDNRDESSDSRHWGTTEKSLIIGRAFVRIWPFDKLTKFTYNFY